MTSRPNPDSVHIKRMDNSRDALSAAWLCGAAERPDIFGDVNADCPYDDHDMAVAWREGVDEGRDWDGYANFSNNPYRD